MCPLAPLPDGLLTDAELGYDAQQNRHFRLPALWDLL
jgi:hypothetical protein